MPYLVPVLLLVIGGVSILWAYFNPRWQRAESYDAALPFALGTLCLMLGSLGVGVILVFRTWAEMA